MVLEDAVQDSPKCGGLHKNFYDSAYEVFTDFDTKDEFDQNYKEADDRCDNRPCHFITPLS